MKIKAIVSLLVALLMANDSVRAQAPDGVFLRYGETISAGYGNSNQVITPYVTFPANRVAPFVKGGCSISAVRIGLAKPASNVTVYLKHHASDTRAIQSQKVGDLNAGWNTVELSTPWQIAEGDLCIGYKANFGEDAGGGAGYDTYESTQADTVFINSKSTWTTISGSFCIQPVISGGTLPKNYAIIDPLPMQSYSYDSVTVLKYLLRNEGTERMNYGEYLINDSTLMWTTFIQLDTVDVNSTDTLKITLDPSNTSDFLSKYAPHIGNNWIFLRLLKVNDDDTSFDTSVNVEYTFERRDPKYMRHILMEEFTGDWCQFCVAGIEEIKYMKTSYAHPEEFVPIAIHVPTDPLALPDNEYSYKPLLDKVDGFPTAYINRMISTSSPWGQVRRYAAFMQESAGTNGISGKAEFNADSTTINITTSLVSSVDIANPDYKISFVLLEDSIDGKQYNGYSGGSSGSFNGWENLPQYVDMKYDDVARGVYNTFDGQPYTAEAILAGSPVEYNYSMDLSKCTINDTRNLHIVALVTNSNGEIANSCNIYPTAVAPTSIKSVEHASNTAAGESVDVYTVSGTHVGKFASINAFKSNGMHGLFIAKNGNKAIKIAK